MRQIEARLGVSALAEPAERPDDARGAGVEVLERARRRPRVPLVGRPEQLRPAGPLRVRDDL
jgi:hypothetical protein